MADIRSMLSDAAPQEAKTETPEPVAADEAATPTPEAVTEAAEKKQEPVEEPLPEGVQKRIAKEVEKASTIQRKIDEAVSARKAKEQELSKLTAESGTAPVQNADAATSDGKPTKPTWQDGQDWPTYEKALAKFEDDRAEWLLKETRRTVEQEFTQRRQQEAAQAKWDEAVKTHGAEFPKLMEKAQEIAPEGLQSAISSLDNWSAVAVYLAKNPAQLTDLAAAYSANPVKAIATLGRIEASLKAPKAAPATPLPAPPVTDGGKASASVGAFDYEGSSMSAFRTQIAKIRKG